MMQWQEIGRRLLEARERLGINQSELAPRVPMTRSHLAHVERGICRCSVDVFARLVRALELSDAEVRELLELAAADPSEPDPVA